MNRIDAAVVVGELAIRCLEVNVAACDMQGDVAKQNASAHDKPAVSDTDKIAIRNPAPAPFALVARFLELLRNLGVFGSRHCS